MNSKKGVIVINKKMLSKNRDLKTAKKESLKRYRKNGRALIKCKIGNLVKDNTKEDSIRQYRFTDTDITLDKLIEYCKKTNLTGMSGNGFPVYRKLEQPVRKIVINAVECEPGLIHDQWLVNHYFEEIIASAAWLKKILKADEVVLAAKELGESDSICINGVRLCKVPCRYPMGEERILLKQILDVDLSMETIPTKEGYLVMNVQTLLQLNSIADQREITGRYITLADLDNGNAKAVFAQYGKSIETELRTSYGDRKYLVSGGGLLNSTVVEGSQTFSSTTCFAAVSSQIAVCSTENKCRGCGKCKRVCPMQIDVRKVITEYEKNPNQSFSDYGIDRCIGCRSCGFVCRADKNPFEIIGELK